MKKICLLMILLALPVVFSGSAQAQLTIEQRVDHFRCYLVPTAPALLVNVQLVDQFDAAAGQVENITQLTIVRHCNTVQKTVNGVVIPMVSAKHHLEFFKINPQPIVLRQVIVKNQFGQQTLNTSDAVILAVPTGKAISPSPAPPAPTDLDHYKCYNASGNAVNIPANLKDQFLSENITVLRPVYFCNPVKKTHGGIVVGILNPDVHLTCYATSASNFGGININIRNQFVALNNLAVRQPDLLCVPSLKLQWAVEAATDPAGNPN